MPTRFMPAGPFHGPTPAVCCGPRPSSSCSRSSPTSHCYFSWHLGTDGAEVCPHVDAPRKLGTHIFYFNTADDWEPAWGGSTLVLSDHPADCAAPDFSDFRRVERTETNGNRSFLFKNQPNAWHGVRTLRCPADAQRRLFNVVIQYPFHRHLLRKAARFVRPTRPR
jgi:hypothetical protein